MKNLIKKIMIIFMIITIFVVYIPVFAEDDNTTSESDGSSTEESTDTEEAEEEDETEALERQKSELEAAVEESEAEMEVVSEELSETLTEVETLSLQISEKQEQISDLEAQEISLTTYIEEAEASLEEYTNTYGTQKALLEQRLVAMYEMGEVKYLDVLLNSENLTDFLSRYYLINEITESDYELVSNVEDAKAQMESITESLKEKKEELEENKSDLEKYRIALSNMEILLNNQVSLLTEEELAIYQKIEDYKNEIETIEAEIKYLALQNVGDVYIGGNMIWPTPGYTTITSSFGMRTHPITGIYKLHTGIDIGAPYGSTFVAAADGVVIKAEYNTAYGNMVMIDHGGGIITLYAHGSEILVEVGDSVTQGTPVLLVGSTGYSTGPHAHFEIRVNGEYVNPLEYVSPTNNQDDEESETIVVNLDEDDDD